MLLEARICNLFLCLCLHRHNSCMLVSLNSFVHYLSPGADPGFLERGFIYIKVWVFALVILSHFFKISHENEIIWFY